MSTLSPTGVQTGTPVSPPTTTPPSAIPVPTPADGRPRPSTLDEIRRARTHIVQGYLGHWYEIQIPDLAFMLSHGEIPENLKQVAMLEVVNDGEPLAERKKEDGTPLLDLDLVKDFYDLRSRILVAALVSPKVELDDLKDLPTEDKDMLQAIATRQRNTDARGVRLGVALLSDWEQFRTAHRCAEDCEDCSAALGTLSTVDLGGV